MLTNLGLASALFARPLVWARLFTCKHGANTKPGSSAVVTATTMASPLVDAIDALEYLLTARLMPEDYDVEELADAMERGEDGDLGVEVGGCGVC